MNRRRFLKATAGFSVAGLATPHLTAAAATDGLLQAIRGSINAQEFGVSPGAVDNQSAAFAKMLEHASSADLPVFLPPGHYVVSNISLPPRVRLIGVPSATKLIHGGNHAFLRGQEVEYLSLFGLVLDGVRTPLAGDTKALLDIRGAGKIAINDCAIRNSGGTGIALERCSGLVERTEVTGAAEYGLYSVNARGLDITGNTVADCGNGGILVHRYETGEDGTAVSANRIARIRADKGGTGQYGNGINLFRAGNVRVSDNAIEDCAFSAIRGNSAGNLQISANSCLRSGETAIYSEFAFEGAIINANIVDGAAHGISIANFDQGGRLSTCTGNIVRNLVAVGPYPSPLAGFGVGISVEADSAVSGNLIENAPLAGIRLGWGPFLRNVVASGNVIREAATGIAVSVVEGTGAATIIDNIIDKAQKGAIVGYRWADRATGDLADGPSGNYPRLLIARNQVS